MTMVDKPPIPPAPADFPESYQHTRSGRPYYYDRDGVGISMWEWSCLFENYDYKVVRKTRVAGVEVSTVWLGIDHNFLMEGPPLIFETMIFEAEPSETEIFGRKAMVHEEALDFQERYATEEEALRRHAEVVEFLTLRKDAESGPPEVGDH